MNEYLKLPVATLHQVKQGLISIKLLTNTMSRKILCKNFLQIKSVFKYKYASSYRIFIPYTIISYSHKVKVAMDLKNFRAGQERG